MAQIMRSKILNFGLVSIFGDQKPYTPGRKLRSCALRYKNILSDKQRKQLDELLRVPIGDHRTPFTQMKAFPKKATLTQVRKWAARLSWLEEIMDAPSLLDGIANSKIKQFAAHAHALEVGDMLDVKMNPSDIRFCSAYCTRCKYRPATNL
jgi:hypothetical protein